MMRLHLRLYLIVAVILFSKSTSAQEDLFGSGMENGSNLNVIYRTERMGKIFASSRGVGFGYRQTKHVTAKRKSFFDIEVQNFRHPREIKSEGSGRSNRRFVYGKLNNVYIARAGLGIQDVIFRKADMKSVEVRYSAILGPVVALAKPYYYNVFQQGGGLALPQKFDSDNFFSIEQVDSRSSFETGLEELRFYPGATAKFNLSFEYAPYTNLVRAIETGISIDYYPRALPMMYGSKAENFIITFNVGFIFGRKWY